MSVLQKISGLLPDGAEANAKGHLAIGGCDTVELAAEFGTPLYVFDESTLRGACAEFLREFGQRYAALLVVYAAKAFLNPALALIICEEGLGMDVVSGGEISIAGSVDFPMEKVYFHGNNKLREELDLAIECGVGRIVVDNLHELSIANEAAGQAGAKVDVLLRLTPGIDAHTHKHITTGIIDSKFGFSMATGQAEEAVSKALSASNLRVVGLHVHLGSLIHSADPYQEAIRTVFRFAAEMRGKYGLSMQEFSPGGGFAVQYTRDDPAPPVAYFAQAITDATMSSSEEFGFQPPRLIVEPGRAIAARAAVALYRTGAIKEIPGVRKYVSVDGGMADNIRPALYNSKYEALIANKVNQNQVEEVSIAGRFCESGDVLVKDASVPMVEPGDLVAVPVSGAYCLSMASNYNASLRPAIVFVSGGKARLVRRRECYEDLIRHDIV
ncbi:MAG: diaminopimelate decarboxylase [Dehalococcoidia bacterium]